MNLLFVDDDAPVLQDLQTKLDWPALGFERVFTAQSAAEALRLVQQVPVDVVVCDIEMPGQSGLDFLAELHAQLPDVPYIVLTSYARFDYAQKAVRLGIVEYLLKPVEDDALKSAVQKAASLCAQRTQASAERRYGQYWLDEQRNAAEYFWLKTALGSTAGLHGMPEKLGYAPDAPFVPVLIETLSNLDLAGWSAPMLEYAIKNVCYEFLDNAYLKPHCVALLSARRCLAVVSIIQGPPADTAPLDEYLAELCATAQDVLQLTICCGLGAAVPYGRFYDEVQALTAVLNDHVDRAGRVLHTSDARPAAAASQTPETALWEQLLEAGEGGAVLRHMEQYLRGRAAHLHQADMLAFRQDAAQMVYAFLKRREIQAHRLFGDKESNRLYAAAPYSIEDMLAYCRLLVTRSLDYSSFSQSAASVVDTVRAYLDAHFTEELQRSDLAGIVYISPDYLSRLFKKETGKSLMQYLIDKRIEAACRLLAESSLPINAVAMQTGFQSFAYFSKVFREAKGMTPMAWRKLQRQA